MELMAQGQVFRLNGDPGPEQSGDCRPDHFDHRCHIGKDYASGLQWPAGLSFRQGQPSRHDSALAIVSNRFSRVCLKRYYAYPIWRKSFELTTWQ